MALKMVVDTLDGLEAGVAALYVAKDGKFSLDVDGAEDVTGLKSALEKERLNGKTMSKLVKDLQDKFSGIDVDAVRAMMAQAETDAESKLIAEGKIKEVLEARLAKHQQETDQKIADKDGIISSLSKKALENIFRAAATTVGTHKGAVEDVLMRGGSLFTLDASGNAVQLGQDGQPILGKDGKTAFTPAEWLEGMKETAPHWFPAGNSGSGGEGQGGTPPDKQIKDPVQRINAARGVTDF